MGTGQGPLSIPLGSLGNAYLDALGHASFTRVCCPIRAICPMSVHQPHVAYPSVYVVSCPFIPCYVSRYL